MQTGRCFRPRFHCLEANYLFVRSSPQRKTVKVRYQIEISQKAREQLRALPKEQRRQIGWRLEEMRDDLRGDVLKLQVKGDFYRLRVGNFRVLFTLEGAVIKVYAVKDRKEAYG